MKATPVQEHIRCSKIEKNVTEIIYYIARGGGVAVGVRTREGGQSDGRLVIKPCQLIIYYCSRT